jgi:hypothetical protein
MATYAAGLQEKRAARSTGIDNAQNAEQSLNAAIL